MSFRGERTSRIAGFYQLDIAQRRAAVATFAELPQDALSALDDGGLDVDTANGMIENVIGRYALPFGIALNFLVDGVDRMVPMVVEEPSVVAAASHAAKLIRAGGGFHTETSAPVMIGQVQLTRVPDTNLARQAIHAARTQVLAAANGYCASLCERGGGAVGLEVRTLVESTEDSSGMLVVHIFIDCRDAMGANIVNSVAEGIADLLAELAHARVGLRILSNLADERMVTARATVPDAALDPQHGQDVREAIVDASVFAELDPYRAATHNKGLLNGVDAVVLATGNDWRSVEAGAHAYAAAEGGYRPLATWRSEHDALVGELTLPMALGTVGGSLQVHKAAQLALRILGQPSATELAAIVASAGLASNLAALRALATDGIQRGHMALHARVIARAAGATGAEIETVAAEISRAGKMKVEYARSVLRQMQKSPRDSE